VRKEPPTITSRREFLIRCAQLAVAVRCSVGALARLQSAEPSAGFGRQELKLVAAAMDEVIPGSDRMPSASAAGGVAYLQLLGWQYDNISKDIGAFLHVLQKASEEESSIGFADLERQRRVALMKRIEKSDPKLFSSFVTYVYEAYYTRPQVQGLLSCSILPVAADDDESLLAPVRKLAPLYRKCHEE
jgi:Gluconate 2-dehydrogenase subunit 3